MQTANTITSDDMPAILDACRKAARAAGMRGADLDDAVQESGMKCWRNRAAFDPTRSRLTTWAYCIAARKCIDLREMAGNRPGQLVVWDELTGERCTKTRGQHEAAVFLDAVFADPGKYLPTQSAMLLEMLLEQVPHAEIAKRLVVDSGLLLVAEIWPLVNAMLKDVVDAANREGVRIAGITHIQAMLAGFLNDHPDMAEYPETIKLASVVSRN